MSRDFVGVGSVRVLLLKCRDVRVRHPFEGICGVSSVYFSWGGVPSYVPERARGGVFTAFSGGAR